MSGDIPQRRSVEVLPDADALASRAVEWLIGQIAHAVAKRGRAVLALSGGTTPKAVFERMSQPPWRDRIAWDSVHVFWGDERFVHPGAQDRNETMAREALLDRVEMPQAHVYPMPADGGPSFAHADDGLDAASARAASAVALHETTLHAFYGGQHLVDERPFFDVVMLGLGEDGHTASLFPESPALDEQVRWVAAVRTDAKPPPVRITMTYPLLQSTHAVLFVVAGVGKRAIARRVLDGDETLPAARVHPQGGTLWLMDRAAAG